eukprot:GHVU01044404.1.p2 GENE.GHVU01044404.1~~GHVU01044404.1.p2  ORF type:complete len:109 (-),score=5.91 GHVU01044404.1:1870-2196(-)
MSLQCQRWQPQSSGQSASSAIAIALSLRNSEWSDVSPHSQREAGDVRKAGAATIRAVSKCFRGSCGWQPVAPVSPATELVHRAAGLPRASPLRRDTETLRNREYRLKQ